MYGKFTARSRDRLAPGTMKDAAACDNGRGWHLQTVSECTGCENPLDLSISIEGGKENNRDSGSSGERSWRSPNGKGASLL